MLKRMLMTTTVSAGLLMAGAAAPAMAADPYEVRNKGWISLTGEVVENSPTDFMIDYGEGIITVEMDDWDTFDEARMVPLGDRVTVYGYIDDDLYEVRKIEANSVYAHKQDTYFYASAADEEEIAAPVSTVLTPGALAEGSYVSFYGSVEDIANREIMVDIGDERMTVDTMTLPYNPLDDAGVTQIDEGDLIRVSGYVDDVFFDNREINAVSLTSFETTTR